MTSSSSSDRPSPAPANFGDETGVWDAESFKDSAPRKLHILCVEDDDEDYRQLSTLLSHGHFDRAPTVVRATCLSDAVDQVRSSLEDGSRSFDLVLLNLSLPDSDGIEAFHALSESHDGIPITIVSRESDPELALNFVKEGAQDFLLKSDLNADILARSILYSVERARAYRELERVYQKLLDKSQALKATQLRLIQTEKLNSIGRIAAGVAHEVKNPLATIQMGVDFFRRREPDESTDEFQMVNLMGQAIDRAEGIIGGMLDFSRTQTLNLDMHNANDMVREVLRMIEHETVKWKVPVSLDLDGELPLIRCDRVMIEQVLINLCNNAIHAMAHHGETGSQLRLRTFWDRIQEIERDEGLRELDRMRPQDYVVVVEIRDEGPGIAEEKLSRIFEPFFTTKPTGEGTGLGLSVAKNIIELHRGHIQVKNVEDPRGLRVRLFFKVYDVPTDKDPPAETLTRPINLPPHSVKSIPNDPDDAL